MRLLLSALLMAASMSHATAADRARVAVSLDLMRARPGVVAVVVRALEDRGLTVLLDVGAGPPQPAARFFRVEESLIGASIRYTLHDMEPGSSVSRRSVAPQWGTVSEAQSELPASVSDLLDHTTRVTSGVDLKARSVYSIRPPRRRMTTSRAVPRPVLRLGFGAVGATHLTHTEGEPFHVAAGANLRLGVAYRQLRVELDVLGALGGLDLLAVHANASWMILQSTISPYLGAGLGWALSSHAGGLSNNGVVGVAQAGVEFEQRAGWQIQLEVRFLLPGFKVESDAAGPSRWRPTVVVLTNFVL